MHPLRPGHCPKVQAPVGGGFHPLSSIAEFFSAALESPASERTQGMMMSDARRAGNNSHVQPPTTSKCKPAAPRSHHSVVVERAFSLVDDLLAISKQLGQAGHRVQTPCPPPSPRQSVPGRESKPGRPSRLSGRLKVNQRGGAISIFPCHFSLFVFLGGPSVGFIRPPSFGPIKQPRGISDNPGQQQLSVVPLPLPLGAPARYELPRRRRD